MEDRDRTVNERVAEGVTLLDQHRPGWAGLLDLDQLDIVSTTFCVLAQLFGDYWAGKTALGIEDEEGWRYGFDSPMFKDDAEEVEDAWREAVAARI